MCLSTTFWSKVQKFCTHLQVNQSEYKKNVLYHINNIGLLDHKYVPIYNFLEHGTKILYQSTILLVRVQKTVHITYKNIGHLNHKYVLIYNFLEQGRRFCHVSGYIIIGVLIESLCLLILQLTLLKKHLESFFKY